MACEAIATGTLIEGNLGRGSIRLLYRVVWVMPGDGVLFLLNPSSEFPIRSSRMPEPWLAADVMDCLERRAIEVVPERLRTPAMSQPDSDLPSKETRERDLKYALIAPLVNSDELLAKTLDRFTRGTVVSVHAKSSGVPVSILYRLLTRFWWFGCDKNALLNLRSKQGGQGRSRLGGEKKKGRPNAVTVLHGVGKVFGNECDHASPRRLPQGPRVLFREREHVVFRDIRTHVQRHVRE